ncbi:MAG: XdhC family protein [Myxococcales bacterium]|nr:XdhC family protein [Myxococcales bacterium]
MREITEAIVEVLRSGARGALATVVRTSGSAPQVAGAKLLLRPEGAPLGTIGGGAVERAVLDALAECAREGKPRLLQLDLGRDLGMCCGGRMEVFVEPIEGSPRLVIFGAGHVACPTAAMARRVGFEVWVVDDREELNTEERFPGCRRLLAEPREAAPRVAPTSADWLFVVTHDHRLDEEALDTYARLPHRYLGVIGSQRKVFRILQRLHLAGGLPPLERVYAPVGLDLGAVTPEEIAVSVLAELVALRHGRPAAHLRAVDDPRLHRVLQGELTPEDAATLPRRLD